MILSKTDSIKKLSSNDTKSSTVEPLLQEPQSMGYKTFVNLDPGTPPPKSYFKDSYGQLDNDCGINSPIIVITPPTPPASDEKHYLKDKRFISRNTNNSLSHESPPQPKVIDYNCESE